MLIVAVAWGQDAPPADPPDVDEEVIVYERLRVEAARSVVIEELKDLGYTRVLEKDGATVLRHDQAWKGDVWLHDDGWMRIRRQPVQVEAPPTPWGKRNSAGSWLGCIAYPFLCVRPGGQLVGTRKFLAVESRTAETVNPEVAAWSDRVADLAVGEKAASLPDRLIALWERGEPLDPGPVLPTPDARKAALLAYWESRTDTPWGEQIRQTVEAFLRAEVQHSEHPFTDDELLAFNARSRASRPLNLTRAPSGDDP